MDQCPSAPSPDAPAYRGRVKYDARTARRYQQRDPARHRAELRLVERAFAFVPVTHRVLDVPCGGGRLTVALAQKGYDVTAADLSDAMLAIARETIAAQGLRCPVEKQDVERLTYPDRSFDTVLCFRLFHHFPTPEIRQRAVNELCRVARQFVVLSYFSPMSFTSWRRKLVATLGGRPSPKHSTPLREVKGYFANAGFRLVRDFAHRVVLHTLHLALFERVGDFWP
ncbi:MAG: class I SAM-dependent methyltransferase [Verrucomicrobiae bacterium]|nr:class I SAM-dependent methyltransferase [Verrucomicrobiae bacterium]MDW8310284.1 class I SAM-dependent methyltransferase [Verrucomicrobiales bacterium]